MKIEFYFCLSESRGIVIVGCIFVAVNKEIYE